MTGTAPEVATWMPSLGLAVMLAVALPPLCRRVRQHDPEDGALARFFAASAVVVLLAAAWDWSRTVEEPRALDVAVVATGAPPDALPVAAAGADGDALVPDRGRVARGHPVRRVRSLAEVPVAAALLAEGLVRDRRARTETLLTWTPAVPGGDETGAGGLPDGPVAADVALTTTAPPLEFEPDEAVRLSLLRPARVGRPTAWLLDVDVPEGLRTVRLEVRASGSGREGEVLLERELEAGELASGPVEIAWLPASVPSGGRADVVVDLLLAADDGAPAGAARTVSGSANVAVADPSGEPWVAVHGGATADGIAAAQQLVEALVVQGLSARRVGGPLAQVVAAGGGAVGPAPAGLVPPGVVVACRAALDPGDQEALARFVDDGGGLLLVGGEDGGALPRPGEPLHPVLPVSCPPVLAVGGPGDGPGDGDGTADGPPPADGEPPGAEPGGASPDDPPAEPPPPPPEASDPPDPPPDPPTEPPADEPPERPGDGPEAAGSDTRDARLEPPGDEGSPGGPPPPTAPRRRVALVLVVDRSGSMNEPVGRLGTRMDFAKRAAYETGVRLDGADRLGIVTFSNSASVLRPLSDLGPFARFSLREEIEAIRASSGGTLLNNGINAAAGMLEGDPAPVRHLVVVTDGELTSANQLLAEAAAASARRDDITVSVVHIRDPETDALIAPSMRRIAEYHGGGRYKATRDPTKVPALVIAEVLRVSGRGPADRVGDGRGADAASDGAGGPTSGGGADRPDRPTPKPDEAPDRPTGPENPPETGKPPEPEQAPPAGEEPREEEAADAADTPPDPDDLEPPRPPRPPMEVRALAPSRLLEPMPADGRFPTLGGLVGVRARPGARVLLVAGTRGLPVLASGHFGLGRVAVWTADLSGPWSAAWRDDEAFPGRLAQWVTSLQPAVADGGAVDGASASDDASWTSWTVDPPAPTPREIAALARVARARSGPQERGAARDGAVGTPPFLDAWQPPEPGTVRAARGTAHDLAFLGLGAMLCLALVEWWLRRRSASGAVQVPGATR